jgi:hypothetical protein
VEGIRSYKHLNEVIVIVLKNNSEREMTAREIHHHILNRYNTGKVRINGVKIAKRLRGRDHVSIRHGKDGLCHYQYIP